MPRGDARRPFELPRTSRPAAGTISVVTVFRDRIVLASSRQFHRHEKLCRLFAQAPSAIDLRDPATYATAAAILAALALAAMLGPARRAASR